MDKPESVLVEDVLSDAAIKKARSEYSFGFTVYGVASRAWYDPKTGEACFYCNKIGHETLFPLAVKIEHAIRESQLKSDIDELDIRNFLCKHLRAMIRVHLTMVDMVKAKMQEKMQ